MYNDGGYESKGGIVEYLTGGTRGGRGFILQLHNFCEYAVLRITSQDLAIILLEVIF